MAAMISSAGSGYAETTGFHCLGFLPLTTVAGDDGGGDGSTRKTVTSILMAGCLFRLRYCFPASYYWLSAHSSCNRTHKTAGQLARFQIH